MPDEPMPSAEDLANRRCLPCEGGIAPLPPGEVVPLLASLPAWRLSHDGTHIRRDLAFPDFRAAVKFVNNVAALAEREGHHPDLHLERYRHVRVEITTHAIGGLSENDVILAAKIDQVTPPAARA